MKKMLVLAVMLVMMMGVVSATATPSTNDENRDNGWAHVNLVGADYDSVTLEFVSMRNFWSCFEYRTDGDESQKIVIQTLMRKSLMVISILLFEQ
jgi:hypothetical protein